MQTGKKKLILDHLIVQKMDDDDGKEDVQNILMFGAQALFENAGGESLKEIHCVCSYLVFHSLSLIIQDRLRA